MPDDVVSAESVEDGVQPGLVDLVVEVTREEQVGCHGRLAEGRQVRVEVRQQQRRRPVHAMRPDARRLGHGVDVRALVRASGLEEEREGVQRPVGPERAHRRHDGRRVEAAAQERADIAAETGENGLIEGLTERFLDHPVVVGQPLGAVERPEPAVLRGVAEAERGQAPSRNPLDACDERPRGMGRVPGEVVRRPLRVDLEGDEGLQRRQAGPERPAAPDTRTEQRAQPDAVARGQCPPGGLVPEQKREGPDQVVDGRVPPVLEGPDDEVGVVGLGRAQRAAQAVPVVEPKVPRQRERPSRRDPRPVRTRGRLGIQPDVAGLPRDLAQFPNSVRSDQREEARHRRDGPRGRERE